MAFENETLGKMLSDPRIARIAPDAIRNWKLQEEPAWGKTLSEIRNEYIYFGDLCRGFERLYRAADSGAWYYPLYTEAECAEIPGRKGTNFLWFPSDDPAADDRPFILLVPGGGFVNVWNLTEGWPVAAQFNDLGYHVFILTYQVDDTEKLLEQNMRDFARALSLIRENAGLFHVRPDRYITCGFSAGGYLICLWNTALGCSAHGLPKPQASFPVYPVTSLRIMIRAGFIDPESDLILYGSSIQEAAEKEYEIPEHAEGFPPCAVFVAEKDDLAGHSRALADALERLSVPCRLEIGPEGCHGFADGTGMSMAGWTERAVRWYETLARE